MYESNDLKNKVLENIQIFIKIVNILNSSVESSGIEWEKITIEDYFNVYDSSGQLISY